MTARLSDQPNGGLMTSGVYKLLLVFIALVLIATFFLAHLQTYLTLESLQSNRELLLGLYEQNKAAFAIVFCLAYTAVAAFSFPGATVFSLAAGAVFGIGLGLVLVSLASGLGATLAFLSARYLFRDWVQQRFGEKLKTATQGFSREGGFYLFSLRVFPLFPFFLVNLLMGLTSMPVRTFIGSSLLGMLPGTLVYLFAGRQLVELKSARDVMSPGLWIAFGLMALLPVVSKKLIQLRKSRSGKLI